MVVKSPDELHQFVKAITLAAGANEHNADRLAEALVSSNLCGVDTHGVRHLPGYVRGIQAGEIKPTASPEILSEHASSAVIKGNWTFGHVTAKYAIDVAIEKAQKNGIAIVSAVELHHIGRLGEYAETAAENRLISLIWAGGFAETVPAAAPYGGRARLLHTNPIAMGFPAGEDTPMIIDYATTAISGVKIENARDKQQPLPPGCIIDKDGNPTTDPAAFYDGGAHIPFGGHKGYALMIATEFLGRILAGSDTYAQKPLGGPIFGHSGMTAIVFRADLFRPFADYTGAVDEMERRTRAVPPAPNFDQVMIPGDLEAKTRAARLRDGIPIPDDLWQQLNDVAMSLGVTVA
ncbi:MAG: Ldh family oxidoreductase [Anaerolineae bacterium]|nr:Ldh family oxidoreductase [Anaerolineae bacterium]